MENNINKIDVQKARQLLEPGGALSLLLKGYEFRAQQQQMLEEIVLAYNNRHIAMIEAGTGIGKSMAYLIPAILWSAQNKERTLISTNTISLQEQLLKKDIPLASRIVGYPLKAVLVKGISNYLCLRKLEESIQEKRYFSDNEANDLHIIDNWKETTKGGTLSELPIAPSHATWEKVCAEGDTCTQRRCPYYNKCFFFAARREAEDAQILIANHSMLFADLAYRKNNEEISKVGLLPEYSRVILDEAHHLEKIATDFFSDKISYLQLLRWLGKLGAEKQGKLPSLGFKLLMHFSKKMPAEASTIVTRINIDLPSTRTELLKNITDCFDAFIFFLHTELKIHPDEGMKEYKLRILPEHASSEFWTNELIPKANSCLENLARYIQSVRSIEIDILNLRDPKLDEQTIAIRQEVQAFANRIEGICEALNKFLTQNSDGTTVKWIEIKTSYGTPHITLVNATLDVSNVLANSLFTKFPTSVLCSATLTTNNTFQFIKNRLGLTSAQLKTKHLTETIYPSPFDYLSQALLLIPGDMPNPEQHLFFESACEKIWRSVKASRGSAFVLFTSYEMLKKCHEKLHNQLTQNGFKIFKQGDANRSSLLETFKHTDKAVLFGTDSFWEGVDVAGEALRCVIIVKLPFKVPSEPITEARAESIQMNGGDPFMDYAIPNAIVKFKQGFGRLIRNNNDRGCIVCLDARLIKKNYGRLFLNSLPKCRQEIPADSDELQQQMESFYQRTYFLTKK